MQGVAEVRWCSRCSRNREAGTPCRSNRCRSRCRTGNNRSSPSFSSPSSPSSLSFSSPSSPNFSNRSSPNFSSRSSRSSRSSLHRTFRCPRPRSLVPGCHPRHRLGLPPQAVHRRQVKWRALGSFSNTVYHLRAHEPRCSSTCTQIEHRTMQMWSMVIITACRRALCNLQYTFGAPQLTRTISMHALPTHPTSTLCRCVTVPFGRLIFIPLIRSEERHPRLRRIDRTLQQTQEARLIAQTIPKYERFFIHRKAYDCGYEHLASTLCRKGAIENDDSGLCRPHASITSLFL